MSRDFFHFFNSWHNAAQGWLKWHTFWRYNKPARRKRAKKPIGGDSDLSVKSKTHSCVPQRKRRSPSCSMPISLLVWEMPQRRKKVLSVFQTSQAFAAVLDAERSPTRSFRIATPSKPTGCVRCSRMRHSTPRPPQHFSPPISRSAWDIRIGRESLRRLKPNAA